MNWICSTCGVQQEASEQAPERCPICDDARQYVGWAGQRWTTLEELRARHRNVITEEEPGVWSIVTEPTFGIGQRAFLVRTDEGNILWDCISLLDDETVRAVTELGGIQAIAISHPHYYSSMIEWSDAFGGAPVWIHEDERDWLQRRSGAVRLWVGETASLPGGATLIRCGGHFDGYQVLHQAGALFAGDQPQVAMDRRWTSFLYSYPNMVPLGSAAVKRIVAALEPYEFERLYGAFPGKTIREDAKGAVRRSAERYLQAIDASLEHYTESQQQLVVELYVRNVRVSAEFYQRLGFQVERAEEHFVALNWERSRLLLEEIPGQPEPPSTVVANMRILVPDVNHYWTLCQELGLRVIKPVEDRYYGLRDFTVVSPDGLGLRFATLI
ncbi:VOC family protein [Paludibaculum fermentans]|uniref:VOC family protein n=1 Tax=Paludibaculum fermentans TaxID=1473598 RepID=UPI003EBAA0B6